MSIAVAKDFEKNRKLRMGLLWDGAHDKLAARQIREECGKDLLFYVNLFCWTYDPRRMEPDIPFITYPFQDDALLAIADCIRGGSDGVILKSRDMGASWVNLTCIEWFWHFRRGLSFLMISRNEDYVDKKGNPKSLFWKIDFLHRHQPKWLLPQGRWLGWNDPNRTMLHMENAETGSVIDGESTTGDAGRGDRRTAVFLDEFAAFEVKAGYDALSASRDTTRCRIVNSTPKGVGNAFYEIATKTAAKTIRMHWSQHPEKNRGLYASEREDENGPWKLKLLDGWTGRVTVREVGKDPREVAFPGEYPFILDGKIRSPWYDNECKRCVSQTEIGQELDIDFLGSDYQFFDVAQLEKYKKTYCREPLLVGTLAYDRELLVPKGFAEESKGGLLLWEKPGRDGRWDRKLRFVMGADVSAGTGASNSALALYERVTKTKWAEWTSSKWKPADFARFAYALGMWFNGALIVPDRSGPTGEVFVKELEKNGYPNLYYRKNEKKVGSPQTDEPGVWLNPQSKTTVMETYRDAMGNNKLVNRSVRAVDECGQYVRKMDGTIEHSGAASTQDPGGARTAHGDIAIADALANMELNGSPSETREVEPETPHNCLKARMDKSAWVVRQREAAASRELSEAWG